ncbi:hypothetical protein LP422_22505 [Janibacter limosus]|uniref:hypothetical protein n=1 Tax=Janibacter limosus TaxID=53458 RepID=UPI0035D967F4|nr:hypothetical protein LP422_22505 [Janibacter limosus]
MTPPAAAGAAPAAKTPVTSRLVSTPGAETIWGSTTEAQHERAHAGALDDVQRADGEQPADDDDDESVDRVGLAEDRRAAVKTGGCRDGAHVVAELHRDEVGDHERDAEGEQGPVEVTAVGDRPDHRRQPPPAEPADDRSEQDRSPEGEQRHLRPPPSRATAT